MPVQRQQEIMQLSLSPRSRQQMQGVTAAVGKLHGLQGIPMQPMSGTGTHNPVATDTSTWPSGYIPTFVQAFQFKEKTSVKGSVAPTLTYEVVLVLIPA